MDAPPAPAGEAPVPALAPAGEHDPHLDGLRGYAALAVMLFHFSIASANLEVLHGFSWLANWTDAGVAVKVFFVLSGYVIGMTTLGVPPTRANIGSYCERRLIRLFPINFFGVLLGCAVSTALSWETVVGSLFFLQNYSGYGQYFLPPPDANGNLWTLNYEALFYTLFVLIWLLKPRAEIIFAGCLALAVVFYRATTPWLSVSCYASGFLFWLSGLCLARCRGASGVHPGRITVSTLVLLLITAKIQAFRALFFAYVPWSWSMPIFPGAIMRPFDLGVLPVCVVLIAEAAGKSFRGLWLVRAFAWLIAAHGFLHIKGTPAGMPASFYGIMLLIALAGWRVRLPARLLSCAAWVGSISFALYVSVYPIQEWVFGVLPPEHIAGAVRDMVIAATVAIVFAWFLEKRFQPWIKGLLPRPARYSLAAG